MNITKKTYMHQRKIKIKGVLRKRPEYIKRDLHTSKETHTHQKRPAKEAYRVSTYEYHLWSMCYVKRDMYTSKETCMHQKRPIHIKRGLQSLNT